MAERLTEYGSHGDLYVKNHDYISASYKLAHYEDLAEQGRLIELPCKPFEKVWVAHLKFPTHQTRFCCNTHILETMEARYVIGYTKEEAEAKLKERGEWE